MNNPRSLHEKSTGPLSGDVGFIGRALVSGSFIKASTPSPIRPFRKRSGFALLITVTLLAFLVLLLVSLASLTRVETQVAANNQEISQARQNALLALQIAVGQLQKYAGPDQRTTARADMNLALVNDPQKNGRWTGVYGSRVAASYTDTPDQISSKIATAYSSATGPDAITQSGSLARKGSQAVRLNWLVSGNESTAFNPLADVAPDGHITLTTSPTPPHTPDDTASLGSATAIPATTDTSTLLVGVNSVSAESDRVTAPLVIITAPESSLPGFDSTSATPRTIGRYSWWVGDENTKAHINLAPEPGTALLPPANPELAFANAQRTAIELIDKVNPVGTSPVFDTGHLIGSAAYDASVTGINKLLSSAQLSTLDRTWTAAGKLRFHDLTAASRSLLTDTYAGGLKKDLSAVLATGATVPADSDHIFVPSASYPANPYLPTWGRLRSFARTTSPVETAGTLTPQLLTNTQAQISPVMTFAELGLEFYQTSAGNIRLALFPRLVLWNPYSRPLAPARYEFGVGSSLNGSFKLQSRMGSTGTWADKDALRRISWNGGTSAPAGGGNYSFMRFIVDVQQPIPAGESHVYVLSGAQPYNAPYGSAPTNLINSNSFIPGYADIDLGLSVATGEEFRVLGDGASAGSVFRGNASYYLGLDPADPGYSETSPNGNIWPGANRKWYHITAYEGVSGSPTYPILQTGLATSPGFTTWGLQSRLNLANGSRHIAIYNPRATMTTAVYDGHRVVKSNQGTAISDAFDPDSGGTRASSAENLNATATGEVIDSILFEFRPEDQPLLSIGQLQHANLISRADTPAYTIGNSLAPFFHLNTNKTDRDKLSRADTKSLSPAQYLGGLHDMSYLLNRALWDRYFVSTVPNGGTSAASVTAIPGILPNPRHVWRESANSLNDGEKRNADSVAAHLILNGGFNINSTSEQAWRAVLAGGYNMNSHLDGTWDDEGMGALGSVMSRFARPPDAHEPVSGRHDWAFKGYRRLSEEQIAALAANIVKEVRARGPFVSLADFVNRRLRDNPDTPSVADAANTNESVQGALQNAIDQTAITGTGSINNWRNFAPFENSGTGTINAGGEMDAEVARGGVTSGNRTKFPFGSFSSYAPQFLTQADVLSTIGSQLSARSDTFSVRTYGEVQNPVTGEITGRAWCEAVVQRTIEPLRRKSALASSPDYYEPAMATSTEADFGRRFKIISFRWLSSSDI